MNGALKILLLPVTLLMAAAAGVGCLLVGLRWWAEGLRGPVDVLVVVGSWLMFLLYLVLSAA